MRRAMTLLATTWLAGMALALAPGMAPRAMAQAEAQPGLSEEGLARAIACQATLADLQAYGEALFAAQPPAWLTRVEKNGHDGMLGLWTYRLARPITVFGRSIDRLSFLNQWVVIELPRAEALALVREQGMVRAPIHVTEQYYHFADPEHGPMLGAFAPTDNAFELLLGGKPQPDEANATLFVGCNYAPMSQQAFLAAAAQADAMLTHDR
jgi:hypothetical protein